VRAFTVPTSTRLYIMFREICCMPDGSVCSSSLPYSRCYVTVQDTSVLQRLMKVFDKKVVSSPSRVYIKYG